jgi:hypothetical protein
MKSLNVIVPTRGRPENIDRLIWAMEATNDMQLTRLLIVVDRDDPKLGDYERLRESPLWPFWATMVVNYTWQKIGPILNGFALSEAEKCSHVAFMGDDHVPRTFHWDRFLVESLCDRPGVAYGDDQFQHANLPTACVVSSSVIRALGYLCPPGLEHLYLDNFWLELGRKLGNIQYLPEVIIEHVHPLAGKAQMDVGYQFSLNSETLNSDGQRYGEFLQQRWPRDCQQMFLNLRRSAV